MRTFWLAIALALVLLIAPASQAAPLQPEQAPLTLSVLQERLNHPIQSDGIRTIDLRQLTIDLRPENAEFRAQFYRLLQAQLRSPTPIGLNFSDSTIQGNLNIRELGLRAPIYGQSLSGLFSPAEQEQLQRDRRRLLQLSQLSRSLLAQVQPSSLQLTIVRGPLTFVQTRFEGFTDFSSTFFLGRIEATRAMFGKESDWSESRFSQPANFSGSTFRQEVRFRGSLFFERARWNQTQFQGIATFQNSEFRATANFSQSRFQQVANFSRTQWQGNADFAQTRWEDQANFSRSQFSQSLFLTQATFEKLVSFREAQFGKLANLRAVSILDQADFGDTTFTPNAYLNVSGLQFNAEKAKILGNPGQLGKKLSVPSLKGNETVLRNLIRNFRLLEQIPDVNQLEYERERLRLRNLSKRLTATNLNTASLSRLRKLGFSPAQVEAIAQNREQQPFGDTSELLRLDAVDLATYVRVRDRIIAQESSNFLALLGTAFRYVGLALLLALSRYGTSFPLIMGIGLVALAYFAGLFWFVDRFRRLHPTPILPQFQEALSMLVGSGSLALVGLSAIFREAESPWLTLGVLAAFILPFPLILLVRIYQQGRYHDLMTVSYFVEDGSLRQVRFLIGRLPNIPRSTFFRDRYAPILWDRRWNWLNYLDFSLNNLLKFGFNDIRLRDEHLPGLVNALAWYQWSLGIAYFAMLLWTLSRTIPGLNLLIYFK